MIHVLIFKIFKQKYGVPDLFLKYFSLSTTRLSLLTTNHSHILFHTIWLILLLPVVGGILGPKFLIINSFYFSIIWKVMFQNNVRL